MAEDTGRGEGNPPVVPVTPNQDSSQYFNIDDQDGSRVEPIPTTAPRRRPLVPQSSNSTRSILDSRSFVASPESTPTPLLPRKPSYMRRTSSNRPAQRAGFFSADDANEEVGWDAAETQARYVSGSRSRQSSTVRRRPQPQSKLQAPLEVNEPTGIEETEEEEPEPTPRPELVENQHSSEEEGTIQADRDDPVDRAADIDEDEDDADLSDTESFTLKDRQEAINETHPFGIRIWKPALYKKSRSVEKGAEGDIHSSPGGMVSRWLWFFNVLWTLLFGWWLALVAATGALLCHVFAIAPGCQAYGHVLWGLARYLFHPFGKYVKLIQDDSYSAEDEGAGRSITEYERWQSGDLEEGRLFFGPVRSLIGRRREDDDSEDGETDSLLHRGQRSPTDDEQGDQDEQGEQSAGKKRRLFGRGEWNLGRVIFFIFFYGLLTPLLFLASGVCWMLIFFVPMSRVTWLLWHHLQRRPLALEFHSDSTYSRGPGAAPSAIILCTYRAAGLKYWKYTVGGTNIILLNLLGVVAFAIFDYFVLARAMGLEIWLTNTIFVFLLSLFSIIPLAYFIGQAVASISAQSTMGTGAVINAFFSTLVEVFLYCVALWQGKSQLVEGSVIGSIFAGILLLPGLSMCFGAVKRKTQRFNVKSAGVTTTMLLFAVIGAFGPTLFYQIYGSHELNCLDCADDDGNSLGRDCRRCFFAQIPAVNDPFYSQVVRPYCWFAAVALFLAYIVGLFFTLRTHAATIWSLDLDEKKAEKMESVPQRSTHPHPPSKSASIDHGSSSSTRQPTLSLTRQQTNIRESPLYKRILGQSLNTVGLGRDNESLGAQSAAEANLPETTSSTDYGSFDRQPAISQPARSQSNSIQIQGLSSEDSSKIVRQMAELAATAATAAARDVSQGSMESRKATSMGRGTNNSLSRTKTNETISAAASAPTRPDQPPGHKTSTLQPTAPIVAAGGEPVSGGHDAPNWSRKKSYVVLFSATIAYAVIAEILVDTVDSVLESVEIDQKFLGITLFALVPNTTEFLNAISFAMNGNIALSMEIGSAYALQVCLLQIPTLVLFSALCTTFDWIDMPTASSVEDHVFSLIFPQWDMVTTILCVFLLAYMYGEGKSNYFKGSILILSYLVVVVGFYMAGFSTIDALDPNDDHVITGGIYRKSRGVGVVVFG